MGTFSSISDKTSVLHKPLDHQHRKQQHISVDSDHLLVLIPFNFKNAFLFTQNGLSPSGLMPHFPSRRLYRYFSM